MLGCRPVRASHFYSYLFVGVRSTLRKSRHYRGSGGNWPSHVTDDEVIRPDETAIVFRRDAVLDSSLDYFFIDPSLLTVGRYFVGTKEL